MDECPHCGNNDAFKYYEYGIVSLNIGIFSEGRKSVEVIETYNTRPEPKYARCGVCEKRFKLEALKRGK